MSGTGTPKKRRRWIMWVVLAVVAVVVAAIVIPMFSSSSSGSTYTTATVDKTTLNVTVSGSGNAVVSDVTEVQPGITGTVKGLAVKLGDTVQAGDLLFKITNTDLDAAVKRAKASLTQARQQYSNSQASVLQAENTLHKAEHPSAIGTAPVVVDAAAVAIAKKQLASAKLGRTAASQSVSSANDALDQAEGNADERTVTAPVGGVITVLNAQNGQSLSGNSSGSSGSSAANAGSTSNSAVEISDLSTLRARVQINEVDLVNVKVGMAAAVTFDALPDLIASGTISAIAPTGLSSSGVVTYNVDITLKSLDARLRPTMSCTAEITTSSHPDTLVVPSSAVRTDSTTQQKYVLVGDTTTGAITQKNVTTGVVVGTQTEILSGLTAGQTVLIGG
ncbi:MAG TPA: efflux RND transporter periplasmic adaptor subunit, partial [Coriobacteriia bacterium]